VSEWLGDRDRVPWVPHIVSLPYHTTHKRELLGIPEDAIVFGRHGGHNTFDIPWVWDTIREVADYHKNIYFVFLNTDQPRNTHQKNIIFLPETISEVEKRAFVNTCDAMIHARYRGETFGLSVGEFAICGKPVLTYDESPERAHLVELEHYGHDRYFYTNTTELYHQIVTFKSSDKAFAYTHFYPVQCPKVNNLLRIFYLLKILSAF
jgi:glycosyltransferase involved in cell wall biosynthesis